MTNLNIPNTLTNGTTADATDVQQNFDSIETHVNTELVNRDGTIPMTGELLLSGSPTSSSGAATKGYVDSAISAIAHEDTMSYGTVFMTGPVVGTVTIPSGAVSGSEHYLNLGSYDTNSSLITRSPASGFWQDPAPAGGFNDIRSHYVTDHGLYIWYLTNNSGLDSSSASASGVGQTNGATYGDQYFSYKVNVGGAGVTTVDQGADKFGYFNENRKNSTSGIALYPYVIWFGNTTTQPIDVTVTFPNGLGTFALYKLFSLAPYE